MQEMKHSWKGLLGSVFAGLFPPSGCMSLACGPFGYLSNRSTIIWGRSLTKTTQHGYVTVWEKSDMNDDKTFSHREQAKNLIIWTYWYHLNSPFQTRLCQIFYLVDPKTDFCVARLIGLAVYYWAKSPKIHPSIPPSTVLLQGLEPASMGRGGNVTI